MNEISQEELKRLFNYDPLTGVFKRRITTSSKAKAGDVVGTMTEGYLRCSIGYKPYLLHRLAWVYVYGALPNGKIDHINGDKSDNSISNLRDVTESQNQQNRLKAQSNNKSGYLGVSFIASNQKYRAVIKHDGKLKILGDFDDPKVAHEVYLKAKLEMHTHADRVKLMMNTAQSVF